MLIVCEGEITEKQYFEQFAKFHRNSLVDVIVEGGKGVPLTVVRAAKERKENAISDAKRKDDEFLIYQLVWCVFDVDNHPNVPEARIMAADNGIELAISNPCFELWLLLHHRDCPGELHRHKAQTMLKDHVAGYDKHVTFDDYRDGYQKAVERQIPGPARGEHGGARKKPHHRSIRADGNDHPAPRLARCSWPRHEFLSFGPSSDDLTGLGG